MNKILAHVICKSFGFHFILIKKTAHFRNLVCVFVCVCIYIYIYIYIHYSAKSIGSPPFNERFDYFSNFHESSQVTFIYIAPLTIQIVTKHCTISK